MKALHKYLLLFLYSYLAFALVACGKQDEPSSTSVVEDQIFNNNWLFYKTKETLSLEEVAAKSEWQTISLPHTMKIEPLIVNDQWQGEGWYKKIFPFDSSWAAKNVFLKFEGAMNVADVWLNGQHLATHLGGYLPFTVQLNSALTQGENILIVRLNNEDNEITGPKPLEQLDFNMYGGLYRDVILRLENDVYITDAVHAGVVGGGGVYVTFPEVSNEKARVRVKTHIQSTRTKTKAHKITLKHQLLRDQKPVVSASSEVIELAAAADQHLELELNVDKPELWHPHAPHLYELHTAVYDGDALIDEHTTTIGIRKFEVTTEGVFINGEKLWLRGVNRHQEYPFVGYALSAQADYRDAWRIKSAGFDYVRLSHYPHSPAFMRAADELGLVLLDAILGWQYINEDPRFTEQVLQTCRDMIRRDRNHPSVLAWECSLNESWMQESLIDEFTRIVKEELPGQDAWSAGWQEYGYDIYLQARQHRIQHYTPPNKPYIVSEYGDWEYYAMNAGLNQDSWGDLLQEERSSRQLLEFGEERLLQQATNIQEAHNDNFNTVAVGDGYWVMFDYNRGYADDLEASGIMSIDRLPKFSYYFYQSQRDPHLTSPAYASGPMVHIASYWQEHSNLNVRVYSNAEELELFLNGESLGRQKPTKTSISTNLKHPPFIFKLEKFVAGELQAKAYIDGKVVATHSVATPDDPYKLQMSSDFALGGVQSSTGDLVFVYAELQNKNDLTVPVSGTQVEFEVLKGAEIIGPHSVVTTAGTASVLLKITDLDSVPIVTAEVAGLPPGRIHLERISLE